MILNPAPSSSFGRPPASVEQVYFGQRVEPYFGQPPRAQLARLEINGAGLCDQPGDVDAAAFGRVGLEIVDPARQHLHGSPEIVAGEVMETDAYLYDSLEEIP